MFLTNKAGGWLILFAAASALIQHVFYHNALNTYWFTIAILICFGLEGIAQILKAEG